MIREVKFESQERRMAQVLAALQENIMRYERTYGPIKIPNQEPRTIAPFGPNKGEA